MFYVYVKYIIYYHIQNSKLAAIEHSQKRDTNFAIMIKEEICKTGEKPTTNYERDHPNRIIATGPAA